MAVKLPSFTQEETAIDEYLGFPKAYATLCNTSAMNPFSYGPPLTFIPYALKPQEAWTVKELNHMFPVVDPGASPSENPRAYANLLWEQLDHLGNADFDPALFRVDPYGNVVYLHADSASPLAWDIDHWFPCQRGGKTVPSNLRILQWQACRKKKNKLDFLIPWWNLQLGISVNQFLVIFSSNNSVYRSRAFSYLFLNGGDEELNAQQTVESHSFPRQFMDARKKVGLAPAAILRSRNSWDATVLKPIDLNISAEMKSMNKEEEAAADQAVKRLSISENENYRSGMDNIDKNPYLTILRARDSLRQRKEVKKKRQAINQLDEELNDLKEKSDTERIVIQELEAALMGRRRRVEKWRRLAEAQASYHALLEKMIRDAMHQSIVYKQQLRMNQAATNALMARLEAQREICDSSENVLRRKYRQRDELEKQAMEPCRQRRKILRMGDADALLDDLQEHGSGSSLFSRRRIRKPTKKELRVFLDEELRTSKCEDEVAAPSGEIHSCSSSRPEPSNLLCRSQIGAAEKDNARKIKDELYQNSKLKGKLVGEGSSKKTNGQEKSSLYKVEEGYASATAKDQELITNKKLKKEYNVATMKESLKQWHLLQCPREQEEENEEYRKQVGKGNVEKWLQRLLENAVEEEEGSSSPTLLRSNPSKEKSL